MTCTVDNAAIDPNADLEEEDDDGAYRSDLWHLIQLTVMELELPDPISNRGSAFHTDPYRFLLPTSAAFPSDRRTICWTGVVRQRLQGRHTVESI